MSAIGPKGTDAIRLKPRDLRGVRLGVMDIVWVYNSMPPAHGQIYPEVSLEPVIKF